MQLCHAPTRLKTTFTRSVRTHIIKQRSAATLPAADLQWIQMAHRAHTLAAWASQPDPQSSPLLLLHRHLAETHLLLLLMQLLLMLMLLMQLMMLLLRGLVAFVLAVTGYWSRLR